MKVELRLANITPLFLAGAEQLRCELRPASVRGALRFWFRAAVGGVIGDNELSLLQQLESEVFGQTERGATVSTRILSPSSFHAMSEPLLPHDHTRGSAPAVPIGTNFNLTLTLKPCTPLKNLEIATWSALLWLTLGGLGRRSRRGAGSVRLIEVLNVSNELSEQLKDCLRETTEIAPDGASLAKRISRLRHESLRAVAAYAGTNRSALSGGLPTFSVLVPETRTIVWNLRSSDLKDYTTALAPLMREMHEQKSKLGADFNAAFGGISPRRASPLVVTGHRLAERWALVMTHLKAKIDATADGKPERVEAWFDQLLRDNPEDTFPVLPGGGSNG